METWYLWYEKYKLAKRGFDRLLKAQEYLGTVEGAKRHLKNVIMIWNMDLDD